MSGSLLSLLFIALVASVHADCTGRVDGDVYVGSDALTAIDMAVDFPSGSHAYLTFPSTSIGGKDAFTFEVDVFARAAGGCIFSLGSGANSIELKVGQGSYSFIVGGTNAVATSNVFTMNQKWQSIAVVVSNTQKNASLYIDGSLFASGAIASSGITLATRTGFFGYCASDNSYFNGAIDNFLLTSAAKTTQELTDDRNAFFPVVPANDLVVYLPFNDAGSNTTSYASLTGAATPNFLAVQASSGVVHRSKAAVGAGDILTDKYCAFSGTAVYDSAGNNVTPFLVTQASDPRGGGYTQTFACQSGAFFTFNQQWIETGGISAVTIKSSLGHRFRVTAGTPLSVEHQDWGGWTLLADFSGIIEEDRSAYIITADMFTLQTTYGWIRVWQSQGVIAYDFAVNSARCGVTGNICQYLQIQQIAFDLNNPPLPEPMGTQTVTSGVANLPATLACPTPQLTGYNPFMYCWGWYVGPKVGYPKDWNGNTWQMSDPGCCNNPAVWEGGQWTVSDWGYMVKDANGNMLNLPWCVSASAPIPPPPPPVTLVPPPNLGGNPCGQVPAANLQTYQANCLAIWGTTQSNGYLTCVAQLCQSGDPNPPPVDCPTARALHAADPSYVVPQVCLGGCPNDCYGQGTCNAGVCTCSPGWTASDCSQPTTYPCWSVANAASTTSGVFPVQLTYSTSVAGSATGVTPLLQGDFDGAYTQYHFPGDYKILDTALIYLVQTIESFTAGNRVPTYHLWIVNNNGNGQNSGAYTLTISGLTGNVQIKQNQATTDDKVDPIVDPYGVNTQASISSGKVVLSFSWGPNDVTGAVIRNVISAGSVSPLLQFSGVTPSTQILIGGASTSSSANLDVYKVSSANYATGVQMQGGTCQNNMCSALTCSSCANAVGCGWCVETGSCMPGGRSGPSFGQCLNWRYTFNSTVSRRLTQVPSYPVNPGMTDVFLSSGDSTDLPIEVGLVPVPALNTQWDVIMLNDFIPTVRNAYSNQIQTLLSFLQSFPNLGVAFMNLMTADSQAPWLVKPIANARDTAGIPAALAASTTIPPNTPLTGSLSVVAGLTKALNNADQVGFRQGTRKLVMVVATRGFNSYTASDLTTLRNALLAKNAIPVFLVPVAQMATYQALVNAISFGNVFQVADDVSDLPYAAYGALLTAGNQVSVFVDAATSGHVDLAQMTSFSDIYAIRNIGPSYRAKFVVPVSSAGGVAVEASKISFPGYGYAQIENVPTDAPTTNGAPTISLNQDTTVVIDLSGSSYRNLMQVFAVVDTLPANGHLYRVQRGTNVNGVPTSTVGNAIVAGQTISDNQVIYMPPAGQSGAAFDSFTYHVIDGCVRSASQSVTINVIATNQPPTAEMLAPTTLENTPIELTLGFYDDGQSASGAPTYNVYVSPITQTATGTGVPTDAGTLYQWQAQFDVATATAITAPNTLVTDSQYRVIYVPPRFANSYADPALTPYLLVLPCFSYQVKETNTPQLFASNLLQVPIIVTHVHQPPFVWDDPEYTLSSLSWPATPAGVCWQNGTACQFLEDFGEQYPFSVGVQYLYLGGATLEGGDLDFVITDIDCPSGMLLQQILVNDRNLAVGDVISNQTTLTLHASILFRPIAETDDSLRGNLGYYCQIKYLARDNIGVLSTNKGVITINIEHVDKPPRFLESDMTVIAKEQQPKIFTFAAVDPDNDPFDALFQGCANPKGSYQFCLDVDCANTYDLDCSAAVPAGGLNLTTVGVIMNNTNAAKVIFTSGPISGSEGLQYNILSFTFSDRGASYLFNDSAMVFQVIFQVIQVNSAPVLTFETAEGITTGGDVTGLAQSVSQPFNPKFAVSDSDIGNGYYTITLSLSGGDDIVFDTDVFPASISALDGQQLSADYPVNVLSDGRNIVFSGQQSAVTLLLQNIQLSPAAVTGPSETVTISVYVTDNGFTGQCASDNTADPSGVCPLNATMSVTVTFNQVQQNNMVSTGAAIGAAGFAGVAAVGAGLLFRKFNKRAEEKYEPWNDDPSEEGIVNNPLYEQSANQGTNPLFEGKNDNAGL